MKHCKASRDSGCTVWDHGKVNSICEELECMDLVIEESPTNYDRIRAMSVDEMAEFLEAETYDSCEHTASWYTEWLQQPAETEGTE